MPVAVVDVGSNTVRLLVADEGATLATARETLRLGADVERSGVIPDGQVARTADVVADFVARARTTGAEAVEVLITSPGRQAKNGEALRRAVAESSGCRTRILSAAEEGELAFRGALACAKVAPGGTVAVVDIGGGSAQVVVGSRRDGPRWTRSIDLGSQRLTSRLLAGDPPGPAAVAAARAEVERVLEDLHPPVPRLAFAVGGSARALKQIGGGRLHAAELEQALALLAETPSDEVARLYGIGAERARTLAGGAAILAGIQQRLGVPLKVARGGLREGAVQALGRERAAAA